MIAAGCVFLEWPSSYSLGEGGGGEGKNGDKNRDFMLAKQQDACCVSSEP